MGGFGLMALFFGILTVTLTLQVRACPYHTPRDVSMELASGFGTPGPWCVKFALPAVWRSQGASQLSSRWVPLRKKLW